jgi:hypothetical protein
MRRVNEFTKDELLEEVRAAELVIGFDTARQTEHLSYGRDTLQTIASSGGARDVATLRLAFDHHTDEIEHLVAACRVLPPSSTASCATRRSFR